MTKNYKYVMKGKQVYVRVYILNNNVLNGKIVDSELLQIRFAAYYKDP